MGGVSLVVNAGRPQDWGTWPCRLKNSWSFKTARPRSHPKPLLPGDGRLVLGAAPRIVEGQVQLIEATGRLLEPGQALSLYEEEVKYLAKASS